MSWHGSASRSTAPPALRLPPRIRACLFDLDGVLTKTARTHAAAWKRALDEFLRERTAHTGEAFRPFDGVADYERFVDGRPRYDGVRTFLQDRGIRLPEEQIVRLGDRKNDLVLELMRKQGVEPYPDAVEFAEAARAAGLRRAAVSASANCPAVLAAAGIEDLFEVRIDGIYARERSLRGKPEPDTFLAAAAALDVGPADAAVFEDAVAGVSAGHRGGFGFVVGVNRTGHADELLASGADIAVESLRELLEDG